MLAILTKRLPSPCHWFGLGLVGAIGALGSAFFSQYMLGWPPCSLCITQRWPYAVVIGIAVLGLALRKLIPARIKALMVLGMGGAFATTGAVGVYHSGVEYDWWEGPQGCTPLSDPSSMTFEEYKAHILGTPITKCDDPTWLIEPVLTMAGGNAIYAFAFTAFMILGTRNLWQYQAESA
ncbi:MAG: disulfide bond formation protein B [Alphaproteobacteria bacterium]